MADGQLFDDAPWFRPGTYSVWVEADYDLEEDVRPAFLLLYEWEIVGLRGLFLVEAWGALSVLHEKAEHPGRDHAYTLLYDDSRGEPESLHSLGLAKAIQSGELRRVGEMPALPGFTNAPDLVERRLQKSAAGKPVDSHP
jgi:hypothetical protein